MSNNVQEFSDINGIFDNNLYNTYRLNQMLNAKDIIDYEITFNLDKVDGEWILNNPDRIMLEKLNGLYNYDIN